MSSISPYINYTNSYYSLGSGAADTAGSAASGTGSAASASTSPSDAFLLDLSDEAKSYLSGTSSPDSTASGSDTGGVTHFALTGDQEKTLETILAKYKDAPYDQTTYDEIQDDLEKAGLSPDTLAAQAQSNSFNGTSTLIDALNGTDVYDSSSSNTIDYSTAKTNFMSDVVSQWQSSSSTYAAAEKEGAGTAAS